MSFCRCSCTSRLIALSSLNQSSTMGRTSFPEEPARPESLDQDERGQRLQGTPSEVAAVSIRVPGS